MNDQPRRVDWTPQASDELAAMMGPLTPATACPTCGSPVSVVSSGEGTAHYESAGHEPLIPAATHNHDASGVYPNCPACGTLIPAPALIPAAKLREFALEERDLIAVAHHPRRARDTVDRLTAWLDAIGEPLIPVAFKDLRGQSVREVHRDDVVVITGEEYLRKSHALAEAEANAWLAENRRKTAIGEG